MIARYKTENILEAAPKTERLPKTSQREDRILVRKSVNDPFNQFLVILVTGHKKKKKNYLNGSKLQDYRTESL